MAAGYPPGMSDTAVLVIDMMNTISIPTLKN